MLRLVLLSVLVCGAFTMVRYDNFKVFEVSGRNRAELEGIRRLQDEFALDVWREGGPDLPAHISVSPDQQLEFMSRVSDLGLEFKVVVENVQDQIDAVDQAMAKIPKAERDITNTYLDYSQACCVSSPLRQLTGKCEKGGHSRSV